MMVSCLFPSYSLAWNNRILTFTEMVTYMKVRLLSDLYNE
jgi:hypothetical protein